MKVCLVGSSGGHLNHLYMLKPFWKDKDHFWVTFDKEDARSLLEGEKMYPCYYPTNRSLKALIKNTKRTRLECASQGKARFNHFLWRSCSRSVLLSWKDDGGKVGLY